MVPTLRCSGAQIWLFKIRNVADFCHLQPSCLVKGSKISLHQRLSLVGLLSSKVLVRCGNLSEDAGFSDFKGPPRTSASRRPANSHGFPAARPFPSTCRMIDTTYWALAQTYLHLELIERSNKKRCILGLAYRWNDDEIAEDAVGVSFAEGVRLFNAGEYYECHDVLESLWNDSADPQRGILHGILQCAVGLHHLLHQNHRGAMVELGEGLTKLRRLRFGCGPLHDFEQEATALLEFIYSTQLEYAACSDDMCITMDGSEKSYQLLGNFGAGQSLYRLAGGPDGFHIEFLSQQTSPADLGVEAPTPIKVKIPILRASEDDLYKLT